VLEAEVHVPSHEGGKEEERHPGVNFINVLRASFCTKVIKQLFSTYFIGFEFLVPIFCTKNARVKTSMKLTTVLLGKSTRWLQETSLLLLARQTQGPVPGGCHRAPADDGEVEDHHQQEQDCRAWSSYSTPCRQGWGCRRFDSRRNGRTE